MRRFLVGRVLVFGEIAAVAGLAAGCSQVAASPTAVGSSVSGTASAPVPSGTSQAGAGSNELGLTPEGVCRQALGSDKLLAWALGTVAQFRAYQYSGPTPHVPLANAFPGVSGEVRGAWCATKEGPGVTHWWAVIPGHPAASLLTIHGPGEGVRRGSVPGPPRIP